MMDDRLEAVIEKFNTTIDGVGLRLSGAAVRQLAADAKVSPAAREMRASEPIFSAEPLYVFLAPF
jgi:hypothetical protein